MNILLNFTGTWAKYSWTVINLTPGKPIITSWQFNCRQNTTAWCIYQRLTQIFWIMTNQGLGITQNRISLKSSQWEGGNQHWFQRKLEIEWRGKNLWRRKGSSMNKEFPSCLVRISLMRRDLLLSNSKSNRNNYIVIIGHRKLSKNQKGAKPTLPLPNSHQKRWIDQGKRLPPRKRIVSQKRKIWLREFEGCQLMPCSKF